MNYADLQVTTHFSFLRGASSPQELFANAALLGIKALGIVDRNSLAGIVRAYEAAKATGVRFIVGCRLDLQCGTSLLVYPTDRAAYGRLCRLLTIGKTRAGKGQCHLDWPDVEASRAQMDFVAWVSQGARQPGRSRACGTRRSHFLPRRMIVMACCALKRRSLQSHSRP
jgi:DNA polymerase III alpha subunit